MDRYLTGGARAVPIVIALDANYKELGHWGPRPAQLQAWVLANLDKPSTERYKHARRWYAKDRGESTLREVLGLPWASSTRRMIWAKTVSRPTLLARNWNDPCLFSVAPNTACPDCLSTGMLSPVSMDSSTAE